MVKCKKCGTDNGMTHYYGKTCKKCGIILIDRINIEVQNNGK